MALTGLVACWLLATSCRSQSRHRVQRNDVLRAANVEEGFDSAILQLNDIENNTSPVALQQIVERVNQWLQLNIPSGAWQPDPLLADLPESLHSCGAVKVMDAKTMQPDLDKFFFHEIILLKHVANVSRGEENDPLRIALGLFEWTARGIQADRAIPEVRIRRPLDALLLGHADADIRAWVFMLLARQQGLNVVQLALGDPAEPETLRPWAQALLYNGQLYLFDMRIGLPIEGPEGRPLATLTEVAADDSLLRRYDIDEELPYPVSAADLQTVTAWMEGSPGYLSRRMQIIESRLAGDQKMILTVAPTALAQQLLSCPQIVAASLWPVPYETTTVAFRQLRPEETKGIEAFRELGKEYDLFNEEPALAKGRALQLKGVFATLDDTRYEPSASRLFQAARYEGLNLRALAEQRTFVDVEQLKKSGKQAGQHFNPNHMRDEHQDRLARVREYASYWLGLVALQRGQQDAAEDYLLIRTMRAYPDGQWFEGARYNLARLYAEQGKEKQAIALFERDTSAQRHGSLLRAKWLKDAASAVNPDTPNAPPPAGPKEDDGEQAEAPST